MVTFLEKKKWNIPVPSNMPAKPAPFHDVDELADTLIDCLYQFRLRGMNDSLERSFVKKTFESENAKRHQALIVRLQKAIEEHEERVEAAASMPSSLAALSPENDTLAIESISMEPISSVSSTAPVAASAEFP
jgi:hypothetical protein